MRTLILVSAMVVTVACSQGYPHVDYFVDFMNSQKSFSNGVLTFQSADEWDSWEATEQVRIDLLAIRSTDAQCSGQLKRTAENIQAVPYELRVSSQGDANEVVFGNNEVHCRTAAKLAEFRISPILPRLSFLDSDERTIAQVEFRIQFEPIVR